MAEIRERRTPPEGLGPMLRRARERAALSQSTVATAVGVQRAYINKLEHSGRCPSLVVAEALCGALALDENEAALLRGCAVDGAGRNHPARRAA
ncbi:helix-turn-helix transcriptional regulator [Streptomyces mirabilis]|uniref:helix-turn-helix transcriptional regulator n=1 Tax=Streptomyces mirabilis TaxID=68239 RepID=UPI0036B72F95